MALAATNKLAGNHTTLVSYLERLLADWQKYQQAYRLLVRDQNAEMRADLAKRKAEQALVQARAELDMLKQLTQEVDQIGIEALLGQLQTLQARQTSLPEALHQAHEQRAKAEQTRDINREDYARALDTLKSAQQQGDTANSAFLILLNAYPLALAADGGGLDKQTSLATAQHLLVEPLEPEEEAYLARKKEMEPQQKIAENDLFQIFGEVIPLLHAYGPPFDEHGIIRCLNAERAAPSRLETPALQTESDDMLSNEAAGQTPEYNRWRLLLYYDAGLLLDTISSTVAVCHLASAEDATGQTDCFIESAGERILILPLRQLLAWKKLAPASQHIYLFENPQVFEVVVDTLSSASATGFRNETKPLPTLICTAGWPSLAALRLLRLLTESSPQVVLHSSGDVDLQGLRIAAPLLARYPNHCRLWCFDPPAYRAALHQQSASLDEHERAGLQRLPEEFTWLSAAMRENGRKADQEGILPLLLQSIQNAST